MIQRRSGGILWERHGRCDWDDELRRFSMSADPSDVGCTVVPRRFHAYESVECRYPLAGPLQRVRLDKLPRTWSSACKDHTRSSVGTMVLQILTFKLCCGRVVSFADSDRIILKELILSHSQPVHISD